MSVSVTRGSGALVCRARVARAHCVSEAAISTSEDWIVRHARGEHHTATDMSERQWTNFHIIRIGIASDREVVVIIEAGDEAGPTASGKHAVVEIVGGLRCPATNHARGWPACDF